MDCCPAVQALASRKALQESLSISQIELGLPPLRRWAGDARAAAEALIREQRELASSKRGIPGFRGPDSWYRI